MNDKYLTELLNALAEPHIDEQEKLRRLEERAKKVPEAEGTTLITGFMELAKLVLTNPNAKPLRLNQLINDVYVSQFTCEGTTYSLLTIMPVHELEEYFKKQ